MEALRKIQLELKTPKGQVNAFGKYKYRSLEDITTALKPLLVKYEATMYFDDIWEGSVLTTTLHYFHADTHIEVHASAVCDSHKGMSTEQSCGSCMSYTHKYALGNLLLIDDSQDPDSMENGGHTDISDHIADIGRMVTVEALTEWKQTHMHLTSNEAVRSALIAKYNQLKRKEGVQ